MSAYAVIAEADRRTMGVFPTRCAADAFIDQRARTSDSDYYVHPVEMPSTYMQPAPIPTAPSTAAASPASVAEPIATEIEDAAALEELMAGGSVKPDEPTAEGEEPVVTIVGEDEAALIERLLKDLS